MAHSNVPNGGQQYASAKKRGVNGSILSTLKLGSRRGSGKSPKDEEATEVERRRVLAKVAEANRRYTYYN